ncbi:hypothetical protein N7481_004807 [Penicillium waksmanii]|uniref:uncharacterized protein n=1 Tax=Penicillium waksmanii TaxID=69791 RepID=UPI0025467514|nr:uncharacterized protein N7481_004807 [Penicillium waksmanii]KAJ5989597.1 hypothetical protein N7481_004807 [Penicillium waksmanii]
MVQQRGHQGNSARSLTIAMGISLAGYLVPEDQMLRIKDPPVLLYGLNTGTIASTMASLATFRTMLTSRVALSAAITLDPVLAVLALAGPWTNCHAAGRSFSAQLLP